MRLITKLSTKISIHKRNKVLKNLQRNCLISVYFVCDMFQYKFDFEYFI